MNARLRERALGHRPRIIAGPGCFVVERLARGGYRSQVKLTDTLPEAFAIAHTWVGEGK